MERREAPGLLPRAPAPRDPPPREGLGSRTLGVQAGRSQGWPKGADRKAPWAPPGAPSLSYGEGRKTGDGLTRQPEKTSSRDSGALAEGMMWQTRAIWPRNRPFILKTASKIGHTY